MVDLSSSLCKRLPGRVELLKNLWQKIPWASIEPEQIMQIPPGTQQSADFLCHFSWTWFTSKISLGTDGFFQWIGLLGKIWTGNTWVFTIKYSGFRLKCSHHPILCILTSKLNSSYPLVNVYITMERSTMFNGKIHYFDWAIFNSYVKLPEGMLKNKPFSSIDLQIKPTWCQAIQWLFPSLPTAPGLPNHHVQMEQELIPQQIPHDTGSGWTRWYPVIPFFGGRWVAISACSALGKQVNYG